MLAIAGWITPSNRFVECSAFSHLEAIKESSVLQHYIPDFDELMSSLDSAEQSVFARIEDGEHPAWHCYHSQKSSIEFDIITELYQAGCLRVAESSDHTLYFEHTGGVSPETMEFCKSFAEQHNKQYVFQKASI